MRGVLEPMMWCSAGGLSGVVKSTSSSIGWFASSSVQALGKIFIAAARATSQARACAAAARKGVHEFAVTNWQWWHPGQARSSELAGALGGWPAAGRLCRAGLRVNESLFCRVQILKSAQTFKLSDTAPIYAACRYDACARAYAIDQHSACAAFTQTAALLGAVELKVIAQHVEQCGLLIHAQSL